MKQELLLIKDVDGLGRSGDIVSAKSGYVRNFLLPKKLALLANRGVLKLQAQLKEKREKQATVDRKESDEIAAKLTDFVLSTEVKVDPEGKMYGSVSSLDISRMMKEKGFAIERRHILLPQPIKNLGVHTIQLKLNEDVPASFKLEITSEVVTIS